MSGELIISILIDVLLILGGLASLLAAVSLVRLPDVYTRLHGAAKAGTLGVFTVMTAAGLHFRDHVTIIEALVVVAFVFLTAPSATHLVARAARAAGMPMVGGTEEARGAADMGNHATSSPDKPAPERQS